MKTIPLTMEQSALVAELDGVGVVILGRLVREVFDGTNAATSGRWLLEAGTVPAAAIEPMRAAVRIASLPPKRPKRARKKTPAVTGANL